MATNFAYDTEALWQQDRDHIIHPWIDLGTARTREPVIVAAAQGVHIFDSRGSK
jgi:putrescine aminotransferase